MFDVEAEKFIFRGKKHYYSCEWASETEFRFVFSPTLDQDFLDEKGYTYFIQCAYFKDEDFDGNEDVDQPFVFERWYEFESVDAREHFFKDRLTEEECEDIKKFMYKLIEHII